MGSIEKTICEEPLKTGDELILQGKIAPTEEKCNLNLLGEEDSIIFQVSIRPKESEVVCNDYSLEDGWGVSEKVINFPVNIEENFEASIKIYDSHFEIHLNGKLLCDFAHRQKISNVKKFDARGVVFYTVQTIPGNLEENLEDNLPQSEPIVEREVAPTIKKISRNDLKPGLSITIKGRISKEQER